LVARMMKGDQKLVRQSSCVPGASRCAPFGTAFPLTDIVFHPAFPIELPSFFSAFRKQFRYQKAFRRESRPKVKVAVAAP